MVDTAMNKTTASDVMRDLIQRSGKTPSAVADDVGISRTTLYYFISGERKTNRIELSVLDRLANYFGYDITVFVRGVDQYQAPVKLSKQEDQLITNYRKLRPEVAKRISEAVEHPPEPLKAEEEQLLALARKLDQRGLERLLESGDDLVSSGKYSI